jgi:hypothetical protein
MRSSQREQTREKKWASSALVVACKEAEVQRGQARQRYVGHRVLGKREGGGARGAARTPQMCAPSADEAGAAATTLSFRSQSGSNPGLITPPPLPPGSWNAGRFSSAASKQAPAAPAR